jgi:hypothetical protein
MSNIINLAIENGYRKDSIKTLIDYYQNYKMKDNTIEEIENFILYYINNGSLDILFLDMEYINPFNNRRMTRNKRKSYDQDYSTVKLLRTLKEFEEKLVCPIIKKKKL